MSGFSFPPPPPPPPKPHPPHGSQNAPQRGDRGRGRGNGQRGNSYQRGRGQSGGGGGYGDSPSGRQLHYQNGVSTSHSAQDGIRSPTSSYRGHTPHHLPGQSTASHSFRSSAASPSRTAAGHKRKLDALRGLPAKPAETKPAPATAPSIPTFGAPLVLTSSLDPKESPSKPNGKRQSKPPGRNLGLTPGSSEPQYPSSDDDDEHHEVDEEAMYAELGDKLTFEHNGVVMSLNSQADLLAWKRDRQKNWPTRARMATKDDERRRVGEERKRLLAGVDTLYGADVQFSRPGSNIWTSGKTAFQCEAQDSEQCVQGLEIAKSETGLEKAKREMIEKTQRLEELRRKVTESEARNKKAKEDAERRQKGQNDAHAAPSSMSDVAKAIETASATAAVSVNSMEEGASPESQDDGASSLDTSSDSDSSDTAAESSDEAPEEASSKAPLDSRAKADSRPVCRYFSASGRCRDGDACKFRHDGMTAWQQQHQRPHEGTRPGHVRKDERPPKLEQRSEKKSIFQRLVEQEEEDDDRLALKVIKYLGQAGLFRASP